PRLGQLTEGDRAVVARALSKKAADRFPSCKAFLEALADVDSDTTPLNPDTHVRPRGPDSNTERMVGTLPVAQNATRVLPGYHLVKCLVRTPAVELWEAVTEEREPCLAKFLYGIAPRDPAPLQAGIARLQGLRDPALPAVRVIPAGPGCLAILTP